ncbi:MAG: glutamate-1-semialdehyde 2,1-aminomutase [Syntrophomonadaceae bacterium]|nr:glutamate-1-semialdehyde 2,1-aminomutase [Syntrophomonadaceae bacterium]
METKQSERLFIEAQKYMPGGVNSPVRAFKSVGMHPLMIAKGMGSKLYDVDGNEFIDYVCSWGPLILGHSHPEIVEAICAAVASGTSFGACSPGEIQLSKLICEAFPSIEQVRLVNSGTEAAMSAVRLARAFTGRDKIIKFEGCYHGHADSFLIKAGSGLLTTGVPTSSGVPRSFTNQTVVCKYNDLESVKKAFMLMGPDIAAVIVEPVAANMGLVNPKPGFLQGLRDITRLYGSLLIFDEIITGFRVCYGGVQTQLDIDPDLTTLGKIIGGGLPVGAYGGKKNIMERIAPQGDVYQAGTLSGNPIAMAAGAATLNVLKELDPYPGIEELTNQLTAGIRSIIDTYELECSLNQCGSMFSLFFAAPPLNDYESVLRCDTDKYANYFRQMLQAGVYLPPSQFEVCFVSAVHSQQDIAKTLEWLDICLNNI